MHSGTRVEVGERPWMSIFSFYLLSQKFCCLLCILQAGWPWSSQTHFPPRLILPYRCATTPSFMWVLGIQTQPSRLCGKLIPTEPCPEPRTNPLILSGGSNGVRVGWAVEGPVIYIFKPLILLFQKQLPFVRTLNAVVGLKCRPFVSMSNLLSLTICKTQIIPESCLAEKDT